MAHTPVGRKVIEQLAKLNDQLCFFLFAEHEVKRELDRFSSTLDERLATDLFGGNPYAQRIDVKLRKLRRYQEENRSASFSAFFSTSYEVAFSYYEEAICLVEACNGVTRQPSAEPRPEHRFYSHLSVAAPIPIEAVLTMEYLRLRRNHWVHRAGAVSTAWTSHASSHGVSLNAWWSTSREPIDFGTASLALPDELETIALIKMLRLSILKMDEAIGTALTPLGILVVCARQLPNAQRLPNRDVIAARSRKVQNLAKKEYGLNATLVEAEQAVRIAAR